MRDLLKWIVVALSCLSLLGILFLTACPEDKGGEEVQVKEGTPVKSMDPSAGGKAAPTGGE